MTYRPGPAPKDVEQLSAFAEEQLREVSESLDVINNLALVELNAEPVKPRDGMVVLADGTNWDPGAGAGFYGYIGAGWSPLSSAVSTYTTRNGITSINIPSVVIIMETTGYDAAGDGGGAIYKRVGSEPSHNLKVQSADGAWWEIVPVNGMITAIAIGIVEGDTAALGAANVTAFNDFILYAQIIGNLSQSDKASAPTLYFPEGFYHFNTHLNVKAAIHMLGSGGWNRATLAGARLVWPIDSHGIIIHAANTLDDTTVAATFAANGAIIERLSLEGGGVGETTGHGIWLRGQAFIRDCRITAFAENGVHIRAGIGAGGSDEGNANLWRLEGVQSETNGGNGIFVNGADVNAGYCIGADCRNNGEWGIFDSSFLGNTYMACHTNLNGVAGKGGNPAGSSSRVEFGGNLYEANAHQSATEAQLVATTPGTDEDIWILVGAGSSSSTIPTWLTAQSEGTYFLGGCYRTDSPNARNIFIGCYREGNQNRAQFVFPTEFYSGSLGDPQGSATGFNSSELFGTVKLNNNPLHGATRDVRMTLNVDSDAMIRIRADLDHSKGLNLAAWHEAELVYNICEHANLRRNMQLTSDLTTNKQGRDAAGGGRIILKSPFIGDNLTVARTISNGTSLRTSGDRAKGEVEFNREPGAGNPFAWICTTAHASTPTYTAVYGVGTQQSNISDPSGGGTVDAEARAAIVSLIAALEHFGFTAP